jgi:hypothetical protein
MFYPPAAAPKATEAPRHWPNPTRARSPALQLLAVWSHGDLAVVLASRYCTHSE